MHNKNYKNLLKATGRYLVVAFIYMLVFFAILFILFGKNINKWLSLVDLVSVKTNNRILENITLDLDNKNLKNYPYYGMQYATLEIKEININLPVFFGDTMTILKKGIGHSSGSYFPGEGGAILYMGHNNKNVLRNLADIKNEAIITVKTSYGVFNYRVFKTDIIKYTEIDKVPINRDKEILMIYTCYPKNAIGHTTKRFVVYASLEGE